MFVGSIKTILGHTEGAAGLAGLLKASLALRHGEIPPNMLLNNINPTVKPFMDHLRIATSVTPWPKTADGAPRRASVNSFGFGGLVSLFPEQNSPVFDSRDLPQKAY